MPLRGRPGAQPLWPESSAHPALESRSCGCLGLRENYYYRVTKGICKGWPWNQGVVGGLGFGVLGFGILEKKLETTSIIGLKGDM